MAYVMPPNLRKFALTVHVTVSVGWTGAVVAYLALAVAVWTSQDVQTVRAGWIGMELIAWYVILPFALGSFLTGLVVALGTRWGLFRHYWVLFTLLLTGLAVAVLVVQLEQISYAAGVTTDPSTSDAELPGAGGQALHAGGGLLVLLVITALNVYKPKGMTPYGRRKVAEQREGTR